MRVLVCGGRDFNDMVLVFDTLDRLRRERGIDFLIHGAANGVDSLAADWANERGVDYEGYPADWRRDGLRAGPLRNARMLAVGAPQLVLAFPGGRGTADMVTRARRAGVEVVEIGRRPNRVRCIECGHVWNSRLPPGQLPRCCGICGHQPPANGESLVVALDAT